MIQFGFWVLLFPLGVLGSAESTVIAFVVYCLSLLKDRRISYLDWLLAAMVLVFLYSWIAASSYSKGFMFAQTGSYVGVLLVMRFLYVCRDQLWDFIHGLPVWCYVFLCVIYLLVQVPVGYTYEVGVLEAFMLIKSCTSSRGSARVLALLLAYLLLMFLISTRTTPLVVAMIIAAVWLIKCPLVLAKYTYIGFLVMSPIYGFIMYHWDVELDVSGIDDNAAIRLEMIKGATSLIGLKEFIFGVGFGVPFRNVDYDYAFIHPLLNRMDNVMQTSNHNSMFDIFLRFGVLIYVLFSVVFLRALKLDRIKSYRNYSILFVTLYSLSVNAYMDSSRLAPSCAALLIGVLLLTSRRFDKVG